MSKNILEMELQAITTQEAKIRKMIQKGQEACADTTELEQHLDWLSRHRQKLLNEKKI